MKPPVTMRDGIARRRILAASLIVIATLLSVAVSSPTVRAQSPTLAILGPAANAVIGNGTPVIVTFTVADFTLVQPGRVGQIVSPNEGHVDAFVDGQYVRLLTRVEPIILNLDSGPHTIVLQLKGNDGQPLSADVSVSVPVIVTNGPAGGTPRITIAFPVDQTGSGHDVYVAVVLSNFTLVDPHGRPNAPNEGHLQVLLRGTYQEELSRYEPVFVVDMPDGDNALTVRLVNNDNTPLSPDVNATVTVHVRPTTATLPEILNFGVTVLLIYVLIILLLRRRKAAAKRTAPPDEKP